MNKETIENFNIVLSKIEKFSEFSPGDILSKLLKPNEKIKQEVTEFNRIVENVFALGTNEDFFIENGEYPWCSLTQKGKKAKKLGGYLEYEKYIEKKDLENNGLNINIENLNQGDNNGVLIQGSRLEKSLIKQKINPAPKNTPEKKSLFKRVYSDPWVIGISLLIIAALLNAERIKNWIDKIIENI
jgi:hypothetical protein